MPRRILVVEDDHDIREMLVFHLKQKGFAVFHAVDALQALTKARQSPPDLMILDFRMPAGDGGKVFDLFRKDSQLGDLPILFISGYIKDVENAVPAGPGVRFLAKPLDLKVMDACIDELLGV